MPQNFIHDHVRWRIRLASFENLHFDGGSVLDQTRSNFPVPFVLGRAEPLGDLGGGSHAKITPHGLTRIVGEVEVQLLIIIL